MKTNGFDQILSQLAQANGSTCEEVRIRMESAMAQAMSNPDPAVQNMWASIPRKGTQLTLDEFMEYLIRKKLLLP